MLISLLLLTYYTQILVLNHQLVGLRMEESTLDNMVYQQPMKEASNGKLGTLEISVP